MKNLIVLFILVTLNSTYALAQNDSKVLICISSSAKAYHSYKCTGLNKCTHSIGEVTVKEAKELGRTPCGYCYKGTTSDNSNSYAPNLKAPANKPCPTVQCTGITQKGARCRNMTTSCGGRCYHHD